MGLGARLANIKDSGSECEKRTLYGVIINLGGDKNIGTFCKTLVF